MQARRPARGPAFCVSHPARGVCRLPSSKHAPPADAPARALASALTSQLRQLPSYCTVAVLLRRRRGSRLGGIPSLSAAVSEAQSSAVSAESAATARLGVAIRLLGQLDHVRGVGWRLAARHWPQFYRGANRRFGGRPPDRESAPPRLIRSVRVLCLLRAARAIAVKSALVSIGRRNSRTPGTRGRWFVCLRGGRRRPRPVERHHEQARMVEHVNRSARDGQSTHRVARARRAVRPNFAPSPGRGLSLSSASMSRSSR